MTRIILKILITALIVTGVSETGKRITWVGAILASLPLTSILALSWLYWDTRDSEKVAELSNGILWAILPSLLFFLIFPILLKAGVKFTIAMPVSCAAMFLGYCAYIWVLSKSGINIS